MKSTKRKPLPFAPRPNPREEEREQRQRDFLRYLAQQNGDRLLEWPPKLRHGKMWKYGTVLKEGELGDEPSL